ncbi:MAG: hypothetical protein RL662_93 [Bacteroidota bacterium]|jgi:short-subunit dehydrogenase
MDINGKHIVITGASSGIGLEVVKLLLRYTDVKIVAVARNIETIPVYEGVVFPFSADLTKPQAVDAVFDYCKSISLNIDIFIANAGYANLEKLGTPDWEHIETVFSLNTFSPIYTLQKLVQTSGDRFVYFVCVSSAVAKIALPYYSLYCSTKAAIHQFMSTYKYESKANVRTMTVYPVATRTAFFEKAAQSEKPPVPFFSQSADTVSRAIVQGIEKNKECVYPSFLFRIFNWVGTVCPSIISIYAANEKLKVEKIQKF